MSADGATASPLLAKLEPYVRDGVNAQLERLTMLPHGVAQQWMVMSDVGAKAQRMASDALAFIGGVAVRQLGLDGGAGDIADALLRHVAKELRVDREFVTLPAPTEYIDVLSEVVRIRYPGNGIWDLPVAVHEFGHYAMPRIGIRSGQPVKAVIDRERAIRPYRGSFAEELWCDVFATYIGGPAYGYSLAARLDPTVAHDDVKPTHPSPATRIEAVLCTLDAVQEAWSKKGHAAGSLQTFRDDVFGLWVERVTSAQQTVEPSQDERRTGTSLAREFIEILDNDEACLGNRFGDGTASREVADRLARNEPPALESSMLEVVNGGWAARRATERAGRGDLALGITTSVTEACLKIVQGGDR